MAVIIPEKAEILVSQISNFLRKLAIVKPEFWCCEVHHSGVQWPASN